jgi:hypothetical protein
MSWKTRSSIAGSKVNRYAALLGTWESVATISDTWNEAPDDSWKGIISGVSNPFLDPLHRQAGYATELMRFEHDMVCHDPNYADRLKKYYAQLRRIHGQSERSRLHEESPGPTVDAAVSDKERRSRKLRLRQLRKTRCDGRRPK